MDNSDILLGEWVVLWVDGWVGCDCLVGGLRLLGGWVAIAWYTLATLSANSGIANFNLGELPVGTAEMLR